MSLEHKCIIFLILKFGYFDCSSTTELDDELKDELQTFGITVAGPKD